MYSRAYNIIDDNNMCYCLLCSVEVYDMTAHRRIYMHSGAFRGGGRLPRGAKFRVPQRGAVTRG